MISGILCIYFALQVHKQPDEVINMQSGISKFSYFCDIQCYHFNSFIIRYFCLSQAHQHKYWQCTTSNYIWNATQMSSRFYLFTFFTIWSKTKQIQQNSFNLTSSKSKILVIWHLKRVVPRPTVLFLPEKSSINETGRSQEHIQNGLQPECQWNLPTPCLLFHKLLQL